MGINENSSQQDREEKLKRRLKYIDVPELYCILNTIFNVAFHISHVYVRLTPQQRNTALKKLIRLLAHTVNSIENHRKRN